IGRRRRSSPEGGRGDHRSPTGRPVGHDGPMPHLVAAPDKFRGTAAASEVAGAVARAGASLGWTCAEVPMADGGEGILDVLGGGGGSATTDGGLGALRAFEPHARLAKVELVVACDVTTTFVDAAEHFAPQKGASPAQVALLQRRLERLAQLYDSQYGVDVRHLPGSGAAGGLAGGLAAVVATLVPGVDLVGDAVGLAEEIDRADLVVTGEGFLDEQSFRGKVVGEVAELSARAHVPVLAVVGEVVDHDLKELGGDRHHDLSVISLVERDGREQATGRTLECVEHEVAGYPQAR